MEILSVYAILVTIVVFGLLGKTLNTINRNKILKEALDNSRRRAADRAEECVRLKNIKNYNDKIIRQLTSELGEIYGEVFYDPKSDTVVLYRDLVCLGEF